MKKILFIFFFAVFFIVNSSFVFSHDISSDSSMMKEDVTQASMSARGERSDYSLSYPGILSDNPLYFIKALRDRIIEFLTSDPVKKSEFYLLTADKRLNEGVMLFDKGSSKYQLAESTISKGENYFEKGLNQIRFAEKQNLPVDSLIQKYHMSSHKHQEVLGDLINKSSGSVKDSLAQSQKRSQQFGDMLVDLEPKK